MALTADEIIELLDLQSHPEGGHYRETWRAEANPDERAAGTAIYFLLRSDEVSHWHRVDAAEVWHWYAGSALELSISPDGQESRTEILGSALEQGQRPQVIVPINAWQSARSLGDWTLVGCTVSPGFEFSEFEMAPGGWRPGAN
ncbi:MAG: cupin domain-containing protein [Alphaproteobacteria bacterium]|nr:cupin domain-containing protein [Alphaproteobacteria bacterium]